MGLRGDTGQRPQLSWAQRVSFHFQGWTSEGVGRWTGSPTGPSRWMAIGFCGYAAVAGCAGIAALAWFLAHHATGPGGPLATVGLVHGVVFGAIGALCLRMGYIRRLVSADELCARVGMTPEQFADARSAHTVKPSINMNGEDLFDMERIAPRLHLLRASSAPAARTDELVRAAAPSEGGSGDLVRPCGASGSAESPPPDTLENRVRRE